MKLALLTDTHFGARSDHAAFDKHFREFFDTVFFPTIQKHKITEIVHLGDVFDKRRSINVQTLHNCMEYFFDRLDELKLHMTVIVGNHDTFYKNTNTVNSVSLVLGQRENVEVVISPVEKRFDQLDILLVPWICDETAVRSGTMLEKSKAPVCFGHFEIEGFSMYRGMPNAGGLDPHIFDRFKLTCSGHFHHRSSNDNIFYLGSPYEMTWSDFNDSRGFHILDTKTLKMEFVKNPSHMFYKIRWDDGVAMVYEPDVVDIAGKCVKLIVLNKTAKSLKKLDEIVDNITRNGVADLKIIEDFSDLESDVLEDENIVVEDTITLLSRHVDALEEDVDKGRVKQILQSLYVEAQNVEQ